MTADAWLAAVEARAAGIALCPACGHVSAYHDHGPCARILHDETTCGCTTGMCASISDGARLVAFARAVLALCDERDDEGGRLVRIEPIRAAAHEHLQGPT